MAIVRSFGALRTIEGPRAALAVAPGGGGSRYGPEWFNGAYATMYMRQPAVRTVVDFLARNIAQLPIQAFRRVSDTDRARLADHELVGILAKPNPATTRYRLIEALLTDLGIYLNAYWLKIRQSPQMGLARLPPAQVTVEGGLVPSRYVWRPAGGAPQEFDPGELVVFGGYNPCTPLAGLSPLETLRQILAEESAASAYREQFWRNSARVETVITRPATAPKWTPNQRGDFLESWRTSYGGWSNAGKTPILEDGMELKQLSASAKDSEYLGSRKLAREEVAAAYHIPLPMVGILDHATFSNIKEQHTQLYQDALGPWLEMVVEELERQLLPECRDTDRVYLEFNLAAKMQGSFEEQARSLQTLIGRPVMTVNEGRARLNLPAAGGDADQLAIQPGTGGPATEGDAAPADPGARPPAATAPPADDEDAEATVADVVRRFWARQAVRVAKQPAAERAWRFDAARWDAELEQDLAAAGVRAPLRLAIGINRETRALLAAGAPAFGPDRVVRGGFLPAAGAV